MAKSRYCARCKAQIPAERIEAVPRTRLCAACSTVIEEKFGGEFRPRPMSNGRAVDT